MGGASDPPPVVLVSCLLLFPRSCCRWLVLMISTPVLEDPLEHLATLPRLRMLPSQQHTHTSLQTCGRRPCSRSHPTRSSLTSCPRTTDLWVFRGRNRSSTKRLCKRWCTQAWRGFYAPASLHLAVYSDNKRILLKKKKKKKKKKIFKKKKKKKKKKS